MTIVDFVLVSFVKGRNHFLIYAAILETADSVVNMVRKPTTAFVNSRFDTIVLDLGLFPLQRIVLLLHYYNVLAGDLHDVVDVY